MTDMLHAVVCRTANCEMDSDGDRGLVLQFNTAVRVRSWLVEIVSRLSVTFVFAQPQTLLYLPADPITPWINPSRGTA